jgi:hypothetical protein
MSIGLRMKRGDTAPPLRAVITDNGAGVDLTPATLRVIGKRNGQTIFTHGVTGTDQGVIVMPWVDGDTAVPGLISIEIEATWPGGTVQTWPASGYLNVLIERDLG